MTCSGWARTGCRGGAVLAGCGRETAVGRRDYAVLSLLARLGLRGAEAAGLRLDDIYWRAGEVVICGKGSRIERLPLAASSGRDGACEDVGLFVLQQSRYRRI
jgi:integrase